MAGRRVPAVFNGMAVGADWMSAASFIGMAGVLYLQGYAGLAYIVGWTGGYCLVALLLAPYLRRFGQFTVPDFIGARYGRLPRVVGVVATIVVSFVYVVVQIYGVGLITSHLTGFSFEIGIFVGLGGVLVCSFLGGMRAVTWTQVAQYIVMIIAYLVPVVWMTWNQVGRPQLPLAHAEQIERVSRLEQRLAADPAELEVRRHQQRRADEAERRLADVPAAMQARRRELTELVLLLKAEDAPLAQIQQAERRLARLPRTEEAARSAASPPGSPVACGSVCGGRPASGSAWRRAASSSRR